MKELVDGLTEKRTPEGICVLRAHYNRRPRASEDRNGKSESGAKYTSRELLAVRAGNRIRGWRR